MNSGYNISSQKISLNYESDNTLLNDLVYTSNVYIDNKGLHAIEKDGYQKLDPSSVTNIQEAHFRTDYINLLDNNNKTEIKIHPDILHFHLLEGRSEEGETEEDSYIKLSRKKGLSLFSSNAFQSPTLCYTTDGSTFDLTQKADKTDLDAKLNTSDSITNDEITTLFS